MDEGTKILIAAIIWKLPALIKQLRILLFGMVDRKRDNKEDE
ncbi:hypothetical protein ABFV70_11330 [Staphylococcus arlettae]